jgi:hypothetical protein
MMDDECETVDRHIKEKLYFYGKSIDTVFLLNNQHIKQG